jgi:hypothetical protein
MQDQDSTHPALPGFWRFYRPRLRDIVSGWWWAANFHNDLVGAVLLTAAVAVAFASWTDALTELGEYASVVAPWLPRIPAWLFAVLLIYAFLRVNYQRFVAFDREWRGVAAFSRKTIDQHSAAQAIAETRVLELEDDLCKEQLGRRQADATIAKLTNDSALRGTSLEVALAERDQRIAAMQADMRRLRTEHDQALTQLRQIEEARPLLRLEPYRLRGTDTLGNTVEWQARLRVVNDRPSIMVRDCYARIVEWGEALEGEWQPDLLREHEDGPYSHAGPLVRVESTEGDFQRETEFIVATIGHRHRLAYFGLDESLKSRYRLHIGVWAVRVEVGASNLGTEPVSRWLRLTVVLVDGEGQPSIECWPELDDGSTTEEASQT